MSLISEFVDPRVYEYILKDTVIEPEILKKLRQETASYPNPNLQISPEQGQFLALMIRILQARNALELGVFTGYSALAAALELPPDGRLVACEKDAEVTKVAQRYWREAGVADKIELRLGMALDSLQKLVDEGRENSFDYIFIDAEKTEYPQYYDYSLRLLRRGGAVIFDNMLREGRVADPLNRDKDAVVIRGLNAQLAKDPRVAISLLPMADGVLVAVKK